MQRSITTLRDATDLLTELQAPPRLIRHAELVSEAAEALLRVFTRHAVPLDHAWIRGGAALHDIGKILHPAELEHPGARHEPDGERLLLTHGVAPHIARCCRSHAGWRDLECTLEELLVALADKLWKGARLADLERRVLETAAQRTQKTFWDLYMPLDSAFESIADDAPARLART